ncbi:MAG: hypothetical protein JRG96_14115 [Deltaproteobacteria bacterium]|nr:hypothetical protein [Deltaproteobacteria bacterium]MBW2418661.1 hypothetical protein [Deltaproteobacteria bacterium]
MRSQPLMPRRGDPLARPSRILRALDPLLFSSVWAACVAGSLALAASLAMELRPSLTVIGLATAGTLVVYNVDRLRDLERDRATAPLRSAFVERNRAHLVALVGAAAVLSLLLALRMEPAVWLLCAAGLVLGLLHRRLKGWRAFKTCYVTAVWIGVVVGLPALAPQRGSEPESALHVAWVTASLGCSLGANLVASNLGQAGGYPGPGRRAQLALAFALSVIAAGVASLGPGTVKPLAWVGIAEATSVLAWRPGERYGLAALDGALLGGGLAAVVFASL